MSALNLKNRFRRMYNIHNILGAIAFRMPWLFSDSVFLKIKYRSVFGKKINLQNPQTYNEKLQWLKLYDHNPNYTKMVDKYEVKNYVASIIGKEHIIPTLALYDRVEDVDFDALPNQFVLKCTHDSGGVVICKDKSSFDKEAAIKKLKKGIRQNFYLQTREWPYKNVKPRIIAEKYMNNTDDELEDYKYCYYNGTMKRIPSQSSNSELSDYKWFCFNGEPKAMFVATDRFAEGEETKFDFYDAEFNHLPFTNGHPNATRPVMKPAGFEEMKELARKLSKGIPHVRVDFYEVKDKVYFGELTFFHWSGFVKFKPEIWDKTFGEWIELPKP